MSTVRSAVTIIVTLFSLLLGASAQASKCYCHTDPYTKTYAEKNGVVKTWYGGKRAWACTYTCTGPNGDATIIGHHQKTYIGKDNGLWGVCDGLQYTEQYNNYIMDFVYALDKEVGLDPEKSTSQDLTKFAATYCK